MVHLLVVIIVLLIVFGLLIYCVQIAPIIPANFKTLIMICLILILVLLILAQSGILGPGYALAAIT